MLSFDQRMKFRSPALAPYMNTDTATVTATETGVDTPAARPDASTTTVSPSIVANDIILRMAEYALQEAQVKKHEAELVIALASHVIASRKRRCCDDVAERPLKVPSTNHD